MIFQYLFYEVFKIRLYTNTIHYIIMLYQRKNIGIPFSFSKVGVIKQNVILVVRHAMQDSDIIHVSDGCLICCFLMVLILVMIEVVCPAKPCQTL